MPHISEHSKGQSVIISASHLEKGKLRLGVAGNHLTCSQLSASETASSGYPNSPYRAWRKRCHCPACALSPTHHSWSLQSQNSLLLGHVGNKSVIGTYNHGVVSSR